MIAVTVEGITVKIDPGVIKKVKFFKLFKEIQNGGPESINAVTELPDLLFGEQMSTIESALSPNEDLSIEVLYEFIAKVLSEVGAKNS